MSLLAANQELEEQKQQYIDMIYSIRTNYGRKMEATETTIRNRQHQMAQQEQTRQQERELARELIN